MSEKIKAFDIFYPTDNEFDIIQTLVMIYLQHEMTTGRLKTMPSSKMVVLLVFYIKNGYSQETKEKALKFMKLTNMQAVDALNFKLKSYGLLEDTMMSKKNKILNQSLQKLSDYVQINEGNKFVVRSIIYQTNGQD